MAKLHDVVTPAQMLEQVRNGALKGELIKKYRTSEQEMAMMLLPLYRSGELSKEEFNDFFKGVALRKQQAPAAPTKEPVAPIKSEDEAPSQIFKALSDKLRPKTPKPPKPEPIAEPEPIVAEQPSEQQVPGELELSEPAPVEEGQSAEMQVPPSEPVTAPAAQEPPAAESVEAFPVPAPGIPEVELVAQLPEEASVLDKIFSKLESIDARLSQIEIKLHTS